MCITLNFSKSDQNCTWVMYIFGHISVKQRRYLISRLMLAPEWSSYVKKIVAQIPFPGDTLPRATCSLIRAGHISVVWLNMLLHKSTGNISTRLGTEKKT